MQTTIKYVPYQSKVKKMVRQQGAWATYRYLRNRGYDETQAQILMYM